jgi:hypothetical protein
MLDEKFREPPDLVKGVVKRSRRDANYIRFAEIAFYAGGHEFLMQLLRMLMRQNG